VIITDSQSVLVLGGGSWGTALAILLANASKRQVKLWVRNQAHSLAMQNTASNEAYLPGIAFPENLSVCDSDTLIGDDNEHTLFLLVVPSHAFRASIETLKASLDRSGRDLSTVTVLWGTKGFDPQTNELLSEVARDILGHQPTLGVVTGPSFAKETANGLPTALVLASEKEGDAQALAQLFKTNSTRVYPSTDIVGAQLGGAVKNVIAVAAGISDGLGFGANARTALITRGLAELTRFGAALGGKMETFMGLSGMGDLVLSCTDDQSRNRRLGLGVGAGRSAQEVIAEIGQEVEGFNTTKELYKKANALGISMPITEQVYAVLHEGRDPKEAVQLLLSRKTATEL
jgi:glycerol-3-phosphate dehydrogenase (NAD(P)+)